ncbi:MAG: hypothetical protein OXF22_10500 [Anaerolineaceae bacterium]|nr:hypothetical protein [Anaerolineaceae bacterium]
MNRLRSFGSGLVGSVVRIMPLLLVFLLGLIWAYNIAPVWFYDAHPSQLEQSWQDNWVTLINDRYVAGSVDGAELQQLLQAVDAPDEIANRLDLSPGLIDLAKQAAPGAAPAPARGTLLGDIWNVWLQVLIFGCLLLVYQFSRGSAATRMLSQASLWGRMGGRGWPGFLRIPSFQLPRFRLPFRQNSPGSVPSADVSAYGAAASHMTPPSAGAVPARASSRAMMGPLLRQETRYAFGMGEYDESFAIEDEYDNFLGECGAAVTETIGVNDPKAAAIEVWLFDKEDFVRTLTHVFATQHAINDPVLRQRLEPKVADGALLLAQEGVTTVLETRALRLEVRITELVYGRDDLPANSHFDQIGLELQVYHKEGVGVASHIPASIGQEPLSPAAMTEGEGSIAAQAGYYDPFDGTGDFSSVG